MSLSGEIPTLGEKSLASQHPMDHHAAPATPALDKTSRTCSPCILCILFARNPSRTDPLVCRYVPLQRDSHIGEKSLASQHPTDHPVPPATPALDITSTTCSPWILCTPLARDSPSSDSVGSKSFPSWEFLLPWGTFPFHPTNHSLPPVTPVLDITSTICP